MLTHWEVEQGAKAQFAIHIVRCSKWGWYHLQCIQELAGDPPNINHYQDDLQGGIRNRQLCLHMDA